MPGPAAVAALLLAASGAAALPAGAAGWNGAGAPGDARARLRVDGANALVLASVGLAALRASAVAFGRDDIAGCRWCEPGALDLRLRRALRWEDGAAAGQASDVLFDGVPAASLLAVAALGRLDGVGARELVEDAALLVASLALADAATVSAKHHAARLRPQAWEEGGPRTPGDLHSFFSGHTSRVFVAAAAATQIARLRGRRGWRWIGIALFGAAAATGWLRVAADQHWTTDVLAGAAAGTAVGLAVPAVALRGAERHRTFALAPSPGGIALIF